MKVLLDLGEVKRLSQVKRHKRNKKQKKKLMLKMFVCLEDPVVEGG